MAKNEIRLQYSGFVIFIAKMLSISTGMIFTLLLTRWEVTGITKEQYGMWGNILDLSTYFVLLASSLPFWTTRFVARKKIGATKTGFFANLIIALVSIAIYIPLVPLITLALNISTSYTILYFLASAQIINAYLTSVLEACLRVKKPQAIGYGLLLAELFKICLAYLLMVRFHMQLLGAMISLIIAIAIQIIYYVTLVLEDFKQKIQWNYLREWLKGSIVNIYSLVGNQIAAFVFILLFVYGGGEARGNYLAASTIANIIAYSFFLSFALYPKLLAERNLNDVTTSLKMVLMFAIPMTAGVIAMPESFLVILDETYREAAPILLLLAIDSLIATISQFYIFVLFGVERLDEEAKIPLRQLAKSNMFKVFTLSYIHSAITLPTTFYVLTNFAVNKPVEAAMYVTIINMSARFLMFLILYVIVRKSTAVIVPWKNIAKYVFASTLMATILYMLPHPTRIVLTVATVVAGGIIYLTLLAAIDRETKMLFNSIWQKIKSKVRGKF